ncbi:RNA-directed DNA polymerase, eukaryota, partial [Tanacetum coccineum]
MRWYLVTRIRDLLLKISLVDPNVEEDSCVWEKANDDTFSVGDTRRLIDSKILPTLAPLTSWDKTLPRKVNILIWRLALDRLPHRLNLSARGMDIPSISCSLCNGNVESSSHIFFDCDFAKEVWRLIRIWCDIPLPTFTSYGHWMYWFTSWQTPKEKSHRLSIIVAASFWGRMPCSWVDWLKAPYKPIEAFKLDLEESPPEATDERCKVYKAATNMLTTVQEAGQAKLMVHLGNMDGNDIDAQRRVRGKCTEKQCPYMTMARRDVIKGCSWFILDDACNVDEMNKILRDKFVDLYQKPVLEN